MRIFSIHFFVFLLFVCPEPKSVIAVKVKEDYVCSYKPVWDNPCKEFWPCSFSPPTLCPIKTWTAGFPCFELKCDAPGPPAAPGPGVGGHVAVAVEVVEVPAPAAPRPVVPVAASPEVVGQPLAVPRHFVAAPAPEAGGQVAVASRPVAEVVGYKIILIFSLWLPYLWSADLSLLQLPDRSSL
jgi:hypothetical protein